MEPIEEDDDYLNDEEREIKELETELIDFLNDSHAVLDTWTEIVKAARKRGNKEAVRRLIPLRDKIVNFLANRIDLENRYAATLEEWEKWKGELDKCFNETEEMEDEEEREDIILNQYHQQEEIIIIFKNICEEARKLKEDFFDLNSEIFKLKDSSPT
jgi:hypothetical protein